MQFGIVAAFGTVSLVVLIGMIYRNRTVAGITSLSKGRVTHVTYKPRQNYDTLSFGERRLGHAITTKHAENTYLVEVALPEYDIDTIEQVGTITYSSNGGFKTSLNDDPRVKRHTMNKYIGELGIRNRFFISGRTASDTYLALVKDINTNTIMTCSLVSFFVLLLPLFQYMVQV